MNVITEQNCTICGLQREEGIRIVSSFICSSCEQEMVTTDVMDEKYPFFISKMKLIFFKKNA